ncbi:hypothetical protein ElyMa_000211300 [Elysia marginata]|uniref:Uncharacterized protein n=1 Tax=Elysia marginata TaxID=1093978 RepID=A0AAV4EXJ0_9GAST|nr:hypothetical protein ElyMa_000211300 [Elysia marginata]
MVKSFAFFIDDDDDDDDDHDDDDDDDKPHGSERQRSASESLRSTGTHHELTCSVRSRDHIQLQIDKHLRRVQEYGGGWASGLSVTPATLSTGVRSQTRESTSKMFREQFSHTFLTQSTNA